MVGSVRPTRASLVELLTLAWPLILSQSIWTFQISLDRAFLSQYSTANVAAGMSAVMMFWMFLALFQFTTNYATTFVAQYTGANQPENVGPVIGQALWFAVVSGLLFLLLIPLSDMLVGLAGHTPELQELESVYFRWMCGSAMPFLLMAATTSFFAGRGDTLSVMLINVLGLVVNGVAAYIFIFGKLGVPPMGIAGAGLATLLGGWAAAIFSLVLVLQPKFIRTYRNGVGWGFNAALFGRLMYFGLPQGVGTAVETTSFSLFLIFIGRIGQSDLAATSIASTLNLIAFLPMMGVGQAIEVLVGQRLGENAPIDAERSTWTGVMVAVSFTAVIAVIYAVFPMQLILPFRPLQVDEAWLAVEQRIPLLLLFIAAYCLFDSVQLIFAYSLRGAGDTRFVTIVTAALSFPFMVLPAWLASHYRWERGTEIAWAWVCLFLVLLATVLYLRHRYGPWRSMRVIEMHTTEPTPSPLADPVVLAPKSEEVLSGGVGPSR
jgi:MATE family multidrug resistance protein